jgi:signal transduction histidine kinase
MEQGTFTLAPVEVDLIPVLYDIRADLENIIQARKLDIKLLLNDHPVSEGEKYIIWGEELLCFSIFSNLVKNAAEASPPLGVITIILRHEEGMAAIEIHNKGSVPEQIRDRFFERYVTFGKNSGTGLGTYSARLITEAQGGNIRLQSSDLDETTVVVHLPIS